MICNLRIETSNCILDVEILDVQDIKKATLKGYLKDTECLVIEDKKNCIVYPIKNIIELKIRKGG